MEQTKQLISATCQCGAVTFSASEPDFLQLACHCEACQSFTAEDFARLVFFKSQSTQVKGETVEDSTTAASGATVTRSKCPQCNTAIFDTSSRFPNMIGVVAETLNVPFKADPRIHAWVKHKQAHVDIPDDHKQFQEGML